MSERYKNGYYRFSRQSSVENSIEDKGYQKGYKDGFYAGEVHVIDITFNIMAYTMGYKLGFGKKRLNYILRAIYNNIDSFRTGQLTNEDYETITNELKEKGITIENILNSID